MKWSEIESLVGNYQSVLYSDEYTEVRPGCDCGCGGEFYEDNWGAWDEMISFNEQTLTEVREFCEKNGIEYDGIE